MSLRFTAFAATMDQYLSTYIGQAD